MGTEELIPSGRTVVDLADLQPGMVSLVTSEGVYLFVNQAYAKWLRMDRSEVIGKNVCDIIRITGGMSDEARKEQIRNVAANGGESEFEISVLHPDGESHCVIVKLVGHENHQAAYSFLTDVTAERTSKINEARYRALVDTAGEGVIVIDEEGAIQSFNKASERLFQYGYQEVMGRNIKILMPETYSKNHDGYLKRYRETKIPKIIGKSAVRAEGKRKDGSVFPAELAVAEFEAEGKIYYTGIIRDMTEKIEYEQRQLEWAKGLERELHLRGRTLDRLFSLSMDFFGICNQDGTFETVSPAFFEITGVPVEEAKVRPFMDFVHPDDLEETNSVFSRLLAGEGVYNFTNRYVNSRNGKVTWLQWNVTPSRDDDQRVYFVARNITTERENENRLRQSQKMEAIGQLSSGIAHDFNNLLMALSGSLEMMNRQLPPESKQTVEKYISNALKSIDRATSLTHRMLAFSRKQPLAPTIVHVNKLIVSMHELITRSIGPSIKVRTHLDLNIWTTLCDVNQLENSILNLMINSRDAMPNGGEITITTLNIYPEDCRARGIPEGEYAKIAVTDTGTGMSNEVKEKAFDPFFTTKPVGKGTGLGLSMLYGFVHQTGGQVRMTSDIGKGTSVMLYLPKTVGQEAERDNSATNGVDHVGDGKSLLLVEDEANISSLILDVTKSLGYSCVAVDNAKAALDLVKDPNFRIDLMISDVGLPGMSGQELSQQSILVRPELPILFITGYAAGVTLRNDLIKDRMDMLMKPFKMDSLLVKIREMITNNQRVEH